MNPSECCYLVEIEFISTSFVCLFVCLIGGFSQCMLLDDNNIRDLRSMLEANIIGLCICTRDAIKSMRQRGFDGHVVNINR